MRSYMMPRSTERSCGQLPEMPVGRDEFALAMAYVPWQYYTDTYEPDKALRVGTIFPELDKPFLAENRGCRRCR